MSRTATSAKGRADGIEGLRSAVADIAAELRILSDRVRDLAESVEAIGPAASASDDGHPEADPRPSPPVRTACEEVTVTVRPLPELAMAAVAETSLRGLPGVKQLVSVERVDDWARFLLEVSVGADLISEMRAAMPVGFTVTDSKPNDISLELKWLWGADSV